MHIVITGAGGFVGRALVQRLLQPASDNGFGAVTQLSLIDLHLAAPTEPAGVPVRCFSGSFGDAALLSQVFDTPVHAVFHLASIPGGTAENDYTLGREVNLDATQRLLEACKAQAEASGPVARFVFASTIGVFGAPLPALVDEDTPCQPQMTYGAQKLIGEILVADFSRRGWIEGCSVRLPGVLARPPARTGQMSAFMSDIIRELAAHRPFTCPTGPEATTWASSLPNVVDNLCHAAKVSASVLAQARTYTLPTQCFTMQALVQAIAHVHGSEVLKLIQWAPDARIEALFGRFPPLRTPRAEAAGFEADADLPTLVRQALAAD